MFRSPALPQIEKLDAVRDHQRIAFQTRRVDFPEDTTRALELEPGSGCPVLRAEMKHRSHPCGHVIEKTGPPESQKKRFLKK
jgi:hypothetical protein